MISDIFKKYTHLKAFVVKGHLLNVAKILLILNIKISNIFCGIESSLESGAGFLHLFFEGQLS